MARVLCMICSSLIIASLYHHVTAQPQRSRPKPSLPFAGFGTGTLSSAGSQLRLRGLCRDGWQEGTSHDLYGNEIPICIKINDKAQTWSEARDTCRQDFGFLLKLDSPIKVDENDLMSLVLSKGITNVWTGVHTDNSHLIWDDLVPTQLIPNNFNQSSTRPWSWSDDNPNKLSQYCGRLSLEHDDDDKRKKRKKRQVLNFDTSESDTNDRLFGSSDSLFGQSSESSSSSSDGYPQASAFQEMLARTQFNDRLAELPRAALGVPSAQQLPGTGLLGNNLQKGGIATVSPLYSQTTVNSDSDSDKEMSQPGSLDLLKDAANLGFQANANMHNINPQTGHFTQGQLFSQPSPTVASSLVGSVKDHVDKLGLGGDLQAPSPTELLETLTEQMNEGGMQSNDNINQDMMGMLSALKELKGDSNMESKTNDNFNIESPGLMNVNPTAQTIFNTKTKPHTDTNHLKSHHPTFRQDLLSPPTTVSPLLMNAFIGQENKNSDDSSSVSENIKDLLHDVATNSDSSQKDLLDSTKDLIKDMQPTKPSHSETLEFLSDKLSEGFTAPSTNLFNNNFQGSDKTIDDSDSSSFASVDPISNAKEVSEKLTEIQKEMLPTDELISDDNKKVDILSPEGNTDMISDILKSDFDIQSKSTADDGDPLVQNKDSYSDRSSDDLMSKIEETISDLPLTDDNPATELTEPADLKILSDDSSLLSDKKDMNLNQDMSDILNSNTDASTDDTDNDAKSVLQTIFTDDTPSLQETLTDLKPESEDIIKHQTDENDQSILNPLTNDDGKLNEIVEEILEKTTGLSSDDTPKETLSSTDFSDDKTIVKNLKDYLSMTKSDSDKQDSDDYSVDSPSDGVSVVENILDESDVLQKETESDSTNESNLRLGIPDTEERSEAKAIVNTTEDFDDIVSSDISDITEKNDSQVLAQDADDKTETNLNYQPSVITDDSEDQVEQLLSNLRLNTTDDGVDNNEDTDHLKSETDVREIEEPSDTKTIVLNDGEDLNANEPSDSIATNEDTISDIVDDSDSTPHSETEEVLNDGSDLLENYNKLLGNNEQDADLNNKLVEEINDLAETVTETDQGMTGKTELPDDTDIPEAAETGDIREKAEEILNPDADTTLEDTVEKVEETNRPDVDSPLDDLKDRIEETTNSDTDSPMDDIIEKAEKTISPDADSPLNDLKDKVDDLRDKVEEITSTDKDTSLDDLSDKVEGALSTDTDTSPDNSMDDMPSLSEALSPENEKTAILPSVGSQEMELGTCRQKLPSVCFSYQLEVKNKVSTCEKGWYGHILYNKCYRIINTKQSYRQSAAQCQSLNANIVEAETEFERMFTLLAVSMDGVLFRGTKFWKRPAQAGVCQYYDEAGIKDANNCNRALNAICEKPAGQTAVLPDNNPEDSEKLVYMMANRDIVLPCGLTNTTHELPVMWFKDGLLVSTITSDDSENPSLILNRDLVKNIRLKTNRDMSMAALQGRYWCEVWDTHSSAVAGDWPIKRRSSALDIRFSDVMSFHGSMALNQFSYKDQALFNLMDKTFPSLDAIETDLKRVFRDVLPVLRGTLDYVSGVYAHVDRVRSSPRVLEYHTYISLNKVYNDNDEIEVYNRLKGLLRAVLGNAQYMSNLPGKTPVTTFRTMALQSTRSCPAAELRTNSLKSMPGRVFKFGHSLLGETTQSNETCSATDLRSAGFAKCLGDFYTGAYWGDVSANDCTPMSDEDDDVEEDLNEEPIDAFNEDIWGKTPQTDTLTEMAKTTVDENNVENITGTVAKITSDALTFTPTDINKIADVLEHTADVEKVTEEVGRNVIETVDKLMTLSEKEVEVANVETKAANRIIKSLEKCAEKVDMKERDNFRLVTDNIALEVWMLRDDSRPVIGLAAHTDEVSPKTVFKPKDIATVFNKSQLFDANVDAAIELPKEAFASKVKGQPARNKLTMMVFRKSKLFEMAAKSSDGRAMNMDRHDISQLNSYVISASIAGRKLSGLKEKVRTIFKPLKDDGNNHNCVFWDFDRNEKKGGWSSEGCIYDGRINGREVCLCDHLTNFAVLLDFYGQENPIHQDHELSLSIITIIGLSFSILGLALTIVSFAFFKKLRQGRAQQTLFNLAVALLCAMLVFLIGIKQTHHYWLCLSSAVLLHYFILASFMWMLMEAILQYLTFVKILGTYITRFTLKTVLPAWGLPLVPVIIILSLDYDLYKGGDDYCWMSLPAFYYGFVIPISCIIVTNIIIFIITIISIFRRGKGLRTNQKKKKVAMTNLQAAITSFILLGLSWLFGYLAIADARLPFQYIFTILNSLQGFFIFILFVVRKKKVRDQWYIICCKDAYKDKVSRSLSASNSIPSSYSNSSRRKDSKGKDRDRSDSTKTVTESLSSAGSFSNGFTNLGYDSSFDRPYSRRAYRNF